MGLKFDEAEGQTPLSEEEREGLLIPAISTRSELDEFEQQNIERAFLWITKQSFRHETIFSEKFIRKLHQRMFGDLWAWAGEFRKTNKNIGIDCWQISTELRKLLDDARYWYDHQTYSGDEIALRFKHRLVSIHCFPNGNGRHSRLMADVLAEKLFRRPVFTWGSTNFKNQNNVRQAYLHALRAADRGDYNLLLDFARH